MIEAGARAPDFRLQDGEGKVHILSDFAGKMLVLYFYPRDDTPGCTKEACGFRDAHDRIRAAGAAVVGISADSIASHAKFRDKYGLPFVLLSDPSKETIAAYGAWGNKKMYGKTVQGIIRSTFIIGADGVVKKVFPKVSPEGHAEEILAALGQGPDAAEIAFRGQAGA
jgi:peroxiredoxin Q/BCP